MTEVFIRELWIYPVKSLGGVRVDDASITPAGSLRLDREWVVVDADGNKIWQGDIPRMTLVRVALTGATLTLSMHGLPSFTLALDHPGQPAPITMYKRRFDGVDAGDAAATWLTAALGQPLRLVRIGDAAHRWDGLNPLHVVSDASIAALNDALLAADHDPVTPLRFRPNVILGSTATPPAYFEESNAVLDFDTARIERREPCVRCELPNISLIDASRGAQPLKLIGRLSKLRPLTAPASFGTYCRAEGTLLATGMRALLS